MTMHHWQDHRITESSGLAWSRRTSGLIYTHNDEDGPIYAVHASSGETLGTCRLSGVTLDDPESISVDFSGAIWIADIGDNDSSRSFVNVFTRGEPGTGNKTLKFTKYRLDYPSGTSHNAETFITWPDGKRQILDKESSGSVYQLPATLKTGGTINRMSRVHGPDSDLDSVSDACVSNDGKWVFVLREGHGSTIYVFNSSWTQVDTISMSSMDKPEGITIQADGTFLWVCDDNSRTPGGKLQSVSVPADYRPAGSGGGAAPAPTPVNPCG